MNGDGHDDVITGHYWPGDIFLFRGLPDGGFAEMENLKDETGRNLNAGAPWTAEKEPRMESLAAAPYAADFDGDGDLDMLIGNILGQVVLMENVGGPKSPLFSTKRRTLESAGNPIQVAGGDAGPVFEDWDRDGKRDLVVGAGDGSVWLYRNEGEASAPRFAAGVALVKASEQGFDDYPHGGAPKGPGMRAKVCVTDVDGDGYADLLLGDMVSEKGPALKLTAEETERRDALRIEREAAYAEMNKVEDGNYPEALLERVKDLQEKLYPLEEHDITHGFVWLYRRIPPAQTAPAPR